MLSDEEFSAFVLTRGRSLASTAAYLSGSVTDAEDILQQALVDTYARLRRIREPKALESYVRTAMVRGVVSGRYLKWRGHEVPALELIDIMPADSPIDRLGDREQVWQLLDELSPKQRAVIVLRYFNDLSEADIASHLGCSKGAVKAHASRAMEKLRAELRPPTRPAPTPLTQAQKGASVDERS